MKQEAQLSQRGRAMQGRIQKVEWGTVGGPEKPRQGGLHGGRSPPGPKISQNVNYTDRGTIEGRATGNSRFEMTKFPPPTEKFPKIPVSQIDSFCGYTRHKKAIR